MSDVDQKTVERVEDFLVGSMRNRLMSLEQAAADLLESNLFQRNIIEEAVRQLRALQDGVINYRVPKGVFAPAVTEKPWYDGPRPGDQCWPALEGFLRDANLDDDAILRIDRESTKVVAHLPAPSEGRSAGRGLVLGYVQSGKTTNFTAVISKAADAGYRLFIVLSGIHNSLRRQTQTRLDDQLVKLKPSLWSSLTTELRDFGAPAVSADALLSTNARRVICVVKKHGTRLENLISWLHNASATTLSNCPILVIDDEADQASINVGLAQRSRINEKILRLLEVPREAYVGYTATPYANLFIDPSGEDLYPKHFIIDLERPDGYFGPDRVFGHIRNDEDDEDDDGYDIVRLVPNDEAAAQRPPSRAADRQDFEPDLTPALNEALRYFLLATAARRARGQRRHSTMLVHTTTYTDVHERLKTPLEQELGALCKRLERGDASLLRQLRELWDQEVARVPPVALGETPTSFSELEDHIQEVAQSAYVIVDNYRSAERLGYPLDEEEDARTVVVVGGNTLSRGLTLQGLVVSYFIRTASAYDTLQQMGRWFGYRRGYSDLPRVWMTTELQNYFQFIALVEEEIRSDIARYEQEHKTPEELVARIRTHHTLAITSALKMGAARKCQISYDGAREQTFIFDHENRDLLRDNLESGRRLVRDALSVGAQVKQMRLGQTRLARVPVTLVERFLREYQFHELGPLKASPICDYISRQNEYGELLDWNVMLIGRAKSPLGSIDVGLEEPIGLMVRSKLDLDVGYANIKSVMSRIDRIADLDLDRAGLGAVDDNTLKGIRADHEGPGLLCLYLIDRISKPERSPKPGKRPRVNLNASEDVLGVGLIFPESEHPETTVEYMAVSLPADGGIEEEEDFDPETGDIEPSYEGAGEPEGGSYDPPA